MIWFVTMLGAVFGLYAKGNQWASRKQTDPVLTAMEELTGTIQEYGQELRAVSDRVSALESKDEVRIGGKSDI